jgi:hypothetical protein
MRRHLRRLLSHSATPLLLAAVIFLFDLILPLGWVVWLPYLALILFPLRRDQRLSPSVLAAVCTGFIIVGFFSDLLHGQSEEAMGMAVFNRTLGVLVLWLVAVLVLRHKKMEDERHVLIDQLESALENIRTLRGFLPICGYCKKVRDDHGYWNQIEAYVTKHSLAEFTHSLCPQCEEDAWKELNLPRTEVLR